MGNISENIKIGEIYGRWTVIEKGQLKISKNKARRQYWVCQCSCDAKTIKEVNGYGLYNGASSSCGCIVKELLTGKTPHNKKYKDIEIGDVFGKWTVIDTSDRRSKRGVKYWLCECSCDQHTQKEVVSESLTNHTSTSCGCVGKEKISELGKKSAKDITGLKFGKLTAIERIGNNEKERPRILWLCKCECGNTTTVTVDALTTGKTKSCGCLCRNDLTGKKFGRLFVLNKDDFWTKKYGASTYKCKCECGNIKYIRQSSLVSGTIKSCGCINKEIEDLVGKRFGQLTVLKFIKKKYYNETSTNIWECECDCGKIVQINQNNLKTGTTQSCGCASRSHGEIFISNLLSEWHFNFLEQYRFDDCKYKNTLPFDFVLIDGNNDPYCIIEFDGNFHYEAIRYPNMTQEQADENLRTTKIRDKIKTDFCKTNHIPLIRIPYWEFNNKDLEYMLFDELVKYKIIEEIKIV